MPFDTEERPGPSMVIIDEKKNTEIPAESENKIQGNEIIFIHDSIHKHIDYGLLAKTLIKL